MHLVGCTIRIYYNAQTYESQPYLYSFKRRVGYELTNFCTFKPITFIPCITLALILPPWWDEHTLCMWMTCVYSVAWYWNIKRNTIPYQSNVYIFGTKLGIIPTCETLKWVFRSDIRSSWMRQIQFSDPIFYLISTYCKLCSHQIFQIWNQTYIPSPCSQLLTYRQM